jgi:hypothetical protein
MSTTHVPVIDMNKLNAFIGQFVTDLGASVHAGMVVIGEKLGLYKALAEGPMTSAQLAAKTGTDERYLREWLASQAAGGYISYDEKENEFSLTEEQVFTMADEHSPAYLPGAFELALGSLAAVPRIAESFRTGAGMGWHEHVDEVFHGCETFFRPGYSAHLVSSWIPALQGVKSKLEAGAKVADVGCGKAPRPCCWRKHSPSPNSLALTTMLSRSKRHVNPRSVKASQAGNFSRYQRQKSSLARTTIWLRCSIACTTWVTRSAPQRMYASRWLKTVPG